MALFSSPTDPVPMQASRPEQSDFDIGILLDAVRRMLEANGDWNAAADMGLPQLCGEAGGSLRDAVSVMAELGRVASLIPLGEAILLNLFASGMVTPDRRVAIAFGLEGEGSGADFRREGDNLDGTLRLVEGAATADLLVLVTADGPAYVVALDGPNITIVPTPALSDGLCDVVMSKVPVVAQRDLGKQAGDMLAVMQLLLCGRALGAATQGFEAVTAYAKLRQQFGQPIGSYQAIQHKLANSHISLSASALVLQNAAKAFDDKTAQWRVLTDAAVAFSSQALRTVALQTQHAFGAVGYADEHEAPALFRRIHTDVIRLGGGREAQRRLGAFMLDNGEDTLSTLLTDAQDPTMEFRLRLRAWLSTNWTSEHIAQADARPFADRDWDIAFLQRLGRDDWTTINWPQSVGGMNASSQEQLAFTEELLRAGAPEHAMICACRIMAPEIIAHGSDILKQALLPELREGNITACLGYSEPEAGSDLASLRTRAIRDGDDYVINGQKIWTTDGHRASHMILAARTDPDPKARHAGISLFILPMNTPGITIRQMTGLHGHVFCNIFFDDVRLPAYFRLGEEGQGWAILSNALANERITMGGFVSRLAVLLEQIIVAVRNDPNLACDTGACVQIGRMVAHVLAGRALAIDSIVRMDAGQVPMVEAAMGKVFASELAQDICETALDLLGGKALLSNETPGAPADGLVEEVLRLSVMYVVGGGSNEIQRSLIARRGLGLGR